MKEKENETIVKHFYNIPKAKETPENYRQVTIILPTTTIHLVSSFEKENIEYLSMKALKMLQQVKQEGK